jgi:two-component system NtrC family sensor kinase
VAYQWRIRHKLLLGMGLVVAIMALLLVGTLKGLSSFRLTMRTFDSKLEELKEAENLKEVIQSLALRGEPNAEPVGEIHRRLVPARNALAQYHAKLKETVERRRDPDNGRREKHQIEAIEAGFALLQAELNKRGVPQIGGPDRPLNNDPLQENHPVRKAIDRLVLSSSDLVGIINGELRDRINVSVSEQRTSVTILVASSIGAVLVMAGLLRFFYVGVARPIRYLEQNVARVAQGDFNHRIELKSGDEIEDLARAFNEMTDRLREMYNNLAQQVNDRSRQLVRSERLAGVGFLAAGVAHEINNPLAAILFASEALEIRFADLCRNSSASGEDQDTIKKYLKMIQEEAFRCKGITQRLLAFSRGGERSRESTDLIEVVQSVLDVVKHLPSCKGKRLEFAAGEPLHAWINAQEIKQVFLNLVVNALDSMDEGGSLTITPRLQDGMAELVFKDTGCGMTPDVLENIFEPFFTRSKTGKGTGLGLSISHRIVTQHHGDIEVSSAGAGQGSTFRVRLPIQPSADEAAGSNEEVLAPEEEFTKLSLARRDRKAA